MTTDKRDTHRVPIPENPQRVDIIEPKGGYGYRDKKDFTNVKAGIRMIDTKGQSFAQMQNKLIDKRVPYASMQAHMEMAATALAAGSTHKLAAARAGISVRQLRNYLEHQDFRVRVEELRALMFSKIRGRVMKELVKRTAPGRIENIELLDLLRVFDRVAGPVGQKAGVNIGEVNVTHNNYDAVLAALITPQRGGQSTDFPDFELDSLALPEKGSREQG